MLLKNTNNLVAFRVSIRGCSCISFVFSFSTIILHFKFYIQLAQRLIYLLRRDAQSVARLISVLHGFNSLKQGFLRGRRV